MQSLPNKENQPPSQATPSTTSLFKEAVIAPMSLAVLLFCSNNIYIFLFSVSSFYGLCIKCISDSGGWYRRGDLCFLFACAAGGTHNAKLKVRRKGCLPCTVKGGAFKCISSRSLGLPGPHFPTALLW